MEEPINIQKESIKLMKMSKGYNWEIKIVAVSKPNLIEETDLDRLEEIDKKLRDRYGKQK